MPNAARVIWITGLSGAGKTTLATALTQRLRRDQAVVQLDGDVLREIFAAHTAESGHHSREARFALAMRYAHLCHAIAQPGITVVIATISMFREVHAWNRIHLPGYVEVYLDVPLEELRRRDAKGLYRRQAEGTVCHLAGIDLAVDEPTQPHLHLVGHASSRPEDFVAQITSYLNQEAPP